MHIRSLKAAQKIVFRLQKPAIPLHKCEVNKHDDIPLRYISLIIFLL